MVERRETETLGDMLLREGLISRDQLEEALKRQKAVFGKVHRSNPRGHGRHYRKCEDESFKKEIRV